MRSKTILILNLFLIFVFNFLWGQTARLDSLDAYFRRSLTDWQVPGMAVAIVKDDSVVLARGYGLKNIKNKKDKVDANTLFPIASNTKAFTVAAIARLIDQGKLQWETKVVDILPYFTLYDPYVTNHFTISDLLSHRSGLATFSGDLLWYGTDYSREAVVRKLAYLEPKYEFRTHFGYSNIMYIAAGEIIEKLSGKPWEQYIRDEFLKPLGMNATLTSINQIDKKTNIVSPHNKVNEKVFPIEFLNWDNISGAGALISNVNDMSRWIKLQLHQGSLDGKEYFSKEQNRIMKSPHISFMISEGSERLWPSTHFKSYGMGWVLSDYHGRKIIGHSGGYDGIISYTCLVPEENLGFVILTNSNSSLYSALMYRILDAYLAEDTTDWSKIFLPYQQKRDMREEITVSKDAPQPTLEKEKYSGIYRDDAYGNLMITYKGGKLELKMLHTPLFHSKLRPFSKDTMLVEFKDVPSLPQGKVIFYTNASDVDSLKIFVPNPDFNFMEFTFRKIPGSDRPDPKLTQ